MSKRKYRVTLRKVYRRECDGEIVGSMPPKSVETMATSARQAENNARYRFGADGMQSRWRYVGGGEQMRVECTECALIA